MNGATIGAIAAAVLAMASAGLTLWVGRTDRASKLTRENMDNLLRDSRTLSAMRTDIWHWEQWGHDVSQQWRERENAHEKWGDDVGRLWLEREQLLVEHGIVEHATELPKIDRAQGLPPFPESELRRLERDLASKNRDDHH